MLKTAEGTAASPHLAVQLPETTSICTIALEVSVRETLVMTEPWTPQGVVTPGPGFMLERSEIIVKAVEVVAVDEGVALGDIGIVIVDDAATVPIGPPCVPSPTAAPDEGGADGYAYTERDERSVKPSSHKSAKYRGESLRDTRHCVTLRT